MALGVAAAGVAVFAQSLRYPFVYDDVRLVPENPAVSGQAPWHAVFTKPYWPRQVSLDPLYRPLTTGTLRLDWMVGGRAAVGYHAVNLLLHAGVAVLVALLACRLWQRPAAGWAAGLLFAVHPLHTDAVVPVVGRGELLAALFVMVLLWRHLGRGVTDAAPSARYHITTAALFAAALTSKEHAAFALPAMMLLDLWLWRAGPEPQGRSVRERLRELAASHYVGLLLVLAGFCLARWAVFGGCTTLPRDLVDPLANPIRHASGIAKVTTPLSLLALAVQQWFMPVNLCPIWSQGEYVLPDTLRRLDVLVGAALLVGMIGVSARGLRRGAPSGWLAAALLCFLVIPCHFVPAANWLYAERWMYLPSAFLAVAIGGLLRYRAGRATAVAATAVALVLTASSWRYQRCWASTEALMASVVSRQPHNYKGLVGVVSILDRTGRLSDAGPYISRLVDRFPESKETWRYQAKRLAADGRWEEAERAVLRYGALGGPSPLPPDLQAICEQADRARRGE